MESNQPPSVHRVPNRGVQSADLAHEWSTMVRDAASKSGIVISSSQTGEFGGVQTMNAELSGLIDKGDHAKILYDACDVAFTQRASTDGAQMSFTSMGNFSCTRRFKFANGDYLGLNYTYPSKGASCGGFSAVFVDASKFLDRTAAGNSSLRSAEQDGQGDGGKLPN